MSSRIFLTRHGKTAANLENRFAGRSAEPLHHEGEEQLAAVATGLRAETLQAIYAGPLPRTAQSAEIVSQVTGAPIHYRDAFNEIDLPHWDGLTKQEITARFGPEYPTWLSAPQDFQVPDCETLAQVQKRAVAEIERLLLDHKDQTVLVVSHLIIIRCLVLHYCHQPISEFRSIKIDNASLTLLSRNKNGQTSVSLALTFTENPL
jgi:broad specificity phosphatase PhoE